ncbi:hypothetical protein [Paenibacillus elgii]|uniref:hypothetical protein n=1 Tax=Paenibacillus elgii TaxID=189691 RepID=UPI0013D2D730|nr:hypothetical protein [Paenibacillus elgii]
MKRQTAWNGFYKAVRESKEYERQAITAGHCCDVAKAWKMAEMRAKKYAKSLVLEHGYQDIHTAKYYFN